MNIQNACAQKLDKEYNKALGKCRAIYRNIALSANPRTELICAYLALPLAAGMLFCVFTRWGSDISPELGWLLIFFLAAFIWHTRYAFIGCLFLADEAIMVASSKVGHPIITIEPATWTDRITKELKHILLQAIAYGLAYLTVLAIDGLSPPPYIRQVPYTGGG